MINYAFENISPKDFEEMCSGLLYSLKGCHFERFKEGKDGGVDLRHIDEMNRSTVFQCKRYGQFKSLYRTLKREEVDKVKELRPNNYGVITSCPLSPPDKEKIFNLFKPYMANSGWVYGRDDLNDMLSLPENSRIAMQTVGLWWQSFDTLKRSLYNAVSGRSLFSLKDFESRNRHTYWTEDIARAYSKMFENRVLILCGDPGVGKTTAAQMMALKLFADGWEFVHVRDGVRDAEDVWQDDCKQFFYYDDFLGCNYREALTDSQASGICQFISRVHGSEDKLLVLTSRTNILHGKASISVPLKKDRIAQSPYCYFLENLSAREKAIILYNRIVDSDVPDFVKTCVKQDDFYHEVIRHENFSPRLVFSVFQSQNFCDVQKKGEIVARIRKLLASPFDVWETVFEDQLLDADIAFVLAVFLTGGISESTAKHVYCKSGGGEREFMKSSEMLSSCVLARRLSDNWNVDYVIYNHSIGDYLIGRFPRFVSRSLGIVLTMYNLKALKRFFELVKLSRDEIPCGEIKGECICGLKSLDSVHDSLPTFCLAYVSELLDLFGEAVYNDVLPLLCERLSSWPDGAGLYVARIVNALDEFDEERWISTTKFDLNSYTISRLIEETEDFHLCARLVQIARRAGRTLEYDMIEEPFTMRVGEYACCNLLSNIDDPEFEIESYNSWSIPPEESERLANELRDRIKVELSYYDIPDNLVDVNRIVYEISLDFEEYFQPDPKKLAEYVEYDRETCFWSEQKRLSAEEEKSEIDGLFNSLI
jgi:DNA polymerase III delta prime subunit